MNRPFTGLLAFFLARCRYRAKRSVNNRGIPTRPQRCNEPLQTHGDNTFENQDRQSYSADDHQ